MLLFAGPKKYRMLRNKVINNRSTQLGTQSGCTCQKRSHPSHWTPDLSVSVFYSQKSADGGLDGGQMRTKRAICPLKTLKRIKEGARAGEHPFLFHVTSILWLFYDQHLNHTILYLSQHTYSSANIYIFRQVGTVNRGLLANCFHLWLSDFDWHATYDKQISYITTHILSSMGQTVKKMKTLEEKNSKYMLIYKKNSVYEVSKLNME